MSVEDMYYFRRRSEADTAPLPLDDGCLQYYCVVGETLQPRLQEHFSRVDVS